MGLFDFLKKKEIEEINQLKSQLDRYKSIVDIEACKLPEAMEYRETLAILDKLNTQVEPKTVEQIIAEEFPSTLTH